MSPVNEKQNSNLSLHTNCKTYKHEVGKIFWGIGRFILRKNFSKDCIQRTKKNRFFKILYNKKLCEYNISTN